MAACAIINQFLVVVYAEDSGVGYSGSDLRPYFPGVKVSTNITGLFGNQVCARCPMAAGKNMKISFSVNPYNRSKMMVAIVLPGINLIFHARKDHKGLRKFATVQIIGNYVRKAFISPPHNIDTAVIFNCLGVHPVIIKHLQGAIFSERDYLGETSAALRKDDARNQT